MSSESSRKAQAAPASGILTQLQVARELLTGLRMAQPVLERRLQIAELRATVVPLARQTDRQHRLVREKRGDGVGELQLAAGARRQVGQHGEDPGRKHITADD